jgi:hypothetical protein
VADQPLAGAINSGGKNKYDVFNKFSFLSARPHRYAKRFGRVILHFEICILH